jgi:CAAX protease family protein
VGSALLFASFISRPRAWQFGLRRTRLLPAVGWASLGLLSFYIFSAIYSVAVQPDVKQKVTESLGADRGALGLIVAGLMVIAVAPAAEEFFFRGFFYRALRSRFPVLVAAVIDGALFGLIHFDFSSAHALLLVPPLAVLGFIFCLVYERTGSIFPTIALHAFNNSLAYAVQADGGAVSAVLGPAVIAACVLLPRLAQSPPRPAPALR